MGAMEVSAKPTGHSIHSPVPVLTTALFWLYRNHAAGAVALVVPEHTREALFQLFCDLRANTPKDARFLRRHAKALMPRTLPGWLALASAFGFTFSAGVALACVTALLSLAGVWAAVGLAIATGTFLACVLAVLGLSLLVAAAVSGAMAAGALSAYAAASVTLGCLRLAKRLLLGAPPNQQAPQTVADARSAAATPASAFAQYQEQQQPALPPLRIKPASRLSPGPSAAAGGGLSPAASPRKAHPAAAGAVAALGGEAAAARSTPSTPSAANGGSANSSNTSNASTGRLLSSAVTAAATLELSAGVAAKPVMAAEAQSPHDSGTPPGTANGAPCTPIAVEEHVEAIVQPTSLVAAA
ncbi:hypothetical protein ABPG75_006762 [Micractinium tetrahymenae]